MHIVNFFLSFLKRLKWQNLVAVWVIIFVNIGILLELVFVLELQIWFSIIIALTLTISI